VFAILKMFGLDDVGKRLLGGNVNSHFNILTMAETLHGLFDRLEFWFEEIPGAPNSYNVRASNPDYFFASSPPPRRRVKFEVAPEVVAACHVKGIPVPELPSRQLLAVRAACSRVAHKSGAAEQIDQIFRDLEETQVMANDGTTADLLTSRLLQSSNVVQVDA